MSKYTTGELAKLCSVSVRTVQFYDQKDLLKPSELTEGGRRLYSEEDLVRFRQICMFKSLGLSLNAIREILESEEPVKYLVMILDEQSKQLEQEIKEQQRQIEVIDAIKENVTNFKAVSLESINDIESIMKKNKNIKKLRRQILVAAIFVTLIEAASILLLVLKGQLLLFILGMIIVFVSAGVLTGIYYKNTSYICPECGMVFKPAFKSFFFAGHTPRTRKLRCPKCGKKKYCVETYTE